MGTLQISREKGAQSKAKIKDPKIENHLLFVIQNKSYFDISSQ